MRTNYLLSKLYFEEEEEKKKKPIAPPPPVSNGPPLNDYEVDVDLRQATIPLCY